MRFTSIHLDNWRNFLTADAQLQRRAFVVGANASGKSNFLDAFRFLRDIADPQGGFHRAVLSRGGVSQLRSLHARRYPNVVVDVSIDLDDGKPWRYALEFTQDNQRRPIVAVELVEHGDEVVLVRPDPADKDDPSRLTQTHLEQVSANKAFRVVAEFLADVRYLHIVPQLVREPDRSVGRRGDPYGGDFLEQLAKTPKNTLDSRLRRINQALRVAVPQLSTLELHRDDRGVPHLRGIYEHWRANAGYQNELQFSDGTLRLLGLLWAFLDGSSPVLLEEPELSLHAGVVRQIPRMMARLGRKLDKQIIVTTHSADLLSEEGIAAEEVILLTTSSEGTSVSVASEVDQIRALLAGGMTVADAVIPRTAPKDPAQLALFGD